MSPPPLGSNNNDSSSSSSKAPVSAAGAPHLQDNNNNNSAGTAALPQHPAPAAATTDSSHNLAQVAHHQLMQAAMAGSSSQQQQQLQQQLQQLHQQMQQLQQQQVSASAIAGNHFTTAGGDSGESSSTAKTTGMDFGSVLAKIQSLEKEKADMRAQLDMTQAKLSKLQESKRAEMEQMMNSTISKWLENLNTTDAGAKEQLKDGLNRLVQSGDESGVWNVIACASSNWVSNVNQIEQLTQQLNEYKEKERLLSGGLFQSEESRVAAGSSNSSATGMIPNVGDKRKIDGISHAHGSTHQLSGPNDIWSEFQGMMMSSGGNLGMDYGIMTRGERGLEQA
jgi:hypothetical protein